MGRDNINSQTFNFCSELRAINSRDSWFCICAKRGRGSAKTKSTKGGGDLLCQSGRSAWEWWEVGKRPMVRAESTNAQLIPAGSKLSWNAWWIKTSEKTWQINSLEKYQFLAWLWVRLSDWKAEPSYTISAQDTVKTSIDKSFPAAFGERCPYEN